MAKKATVKKTKATLADKDHPSLVEVGGKLRLRVLEDFNVEQELPKWKRFHEEWDRVRRELGIRRDSTDSELENKVSLLGKTDAEKADILARTKALIAMDKAVQDDRWDIRGKHERETSEAVLKQARYVRGLTWWDKLKNLLHVGPRVVPVDVAMADLLAHLELTSTPELAANMRKLDQIEANMRAAGQYKRADSVRALRTIVAEEAVVVAAGFASYVPEDVMVEFLRKSERGTAVDFLRYYEDEIPPEVVARKVEVDNLMVFDNYVVAHYSDLIRKAAAVEDETSEAEEKKAREKRRDPILFGLIKNSRKLYYICDWKTDVDDLTLEKLEKELGVTRSSLVDGSATQIERDAAESNVVNTTNTANTALLLRQLEAADRARWAAETLLYSDSPGELYDGTVAYTARR